MTFSVLSLKPGHDGTVCVLRDGKLVFSFEAEKDSFPRYAPIGPATLLDAFAMSENIPDVIAISGWVKGFHSVEPPLGAGYWGVGADTLQRSRTRIFGKEVELFSSSHERAHLYCAYGMSPISAGEPAYVLLWEGTIGAFYEINERMEARKIGDVLPEPGNKYAFLYALADPSYQDRFDFSAAGKLMALAGASDRSPMTADEWETAREILHSAILKQTPKSEFSWSPYSNIGVRDQNFRTLAGKFSDALFDVFYRYARQHLEPGRPLLIVGGCGLNCEWNTKWRECGWFSSVFVPPCANDTGAALGTAVDAQGTINGQWKVEWSVYCGQEFRADVDPTTSNSVAVTPTTAAEIAQFLESGNVIAWIQGRCEMGPRALGNRSLLASPFATTMRERLNRIKSREEYRPIAPVCLQEDASKYFDGPLPSPHMLYFHRILDRRLGAVAHIDGTARVQTVSEQENRPLWELLCAFRQRTGYGVLCNTSLNFNGRGFLNSMSDVLQFLDEFDVDGAVVQGMFIQRRS